MSARKDFLSQRAPENYVAGLGRGATGFTTRSDLGSHRSGPDEQQMKDMLARRAAALGAAPPTAYGAGDKKKGAGANDDDDGGDDGRYQDPDNEEGLFARGMYDREDDEADRIYQEVDEKMERRRRQRREEREKREQEEYERNNPKVSEQFADLKRSLASVTEDDWSNIPEVGDLTRKNKRQKQNEQKRFYAVPDSVLAGAAGSLQYETSVQEDGGSGGGDNADGTLTNFADIGAARDKVLQARLDQAASSGNESMSGTKTNIDPKGYLTSLSKSELAGQVEVGDVNRVRTLLESVIKTNPKHAPGWIAKARLEEVAGKIAAARDAIARGCEICPKSEDAWLENIRLNGENKHNAKIIAAKAIKQNDKSTILWIEAMKLEDTVAAKKRVIRKAIDHIPQSVNIWKEAVNLEENPDDAKLMLAKATDVIPQSEDLWLALARLETAENAQKVLNNARKRIPTSNQIWLAAVRLIEQTSGDASKVDSVMNRAVRALVKESAMPKREEWIELAEKCDEEGATLTCGAIIRQTLGYGLDEDDDRKEAWLDDARTSIQKDRFETARAMYAYTLRVFPTSKSVWQAAAALEKDHGSRTALEQLLEKAVEACPNAEDLWMQLAKEKWQGGDLDGARRILGRAFNQNENNEDIWLAAVKLEADNGQIDQARELLQTARASAGTDRVWIKSVAFERNIGDEEAALDLANQGLQIHPKADKLWMMKGQIYQATGKTPQAREAFSTGTRACPKSVPLWLLLSRLEESSGAIVKARSVLDRARLALPKNDTIWTESVRVERRAGNTSQAKTIMAKALQEVPASGRLWSERIMHLETRTQRKPLLLEGMKKANDDPLLFVTAARIFWAARQLDKAASWFERAVKRDPDDGDIWAWYYKFLMQHGTEEKKQETLDACAAVEPKHGEVWQIIAKDPAVLVKANAANAANVAATEAAQKDGTNGRQGEKAAMGPREVLRLVVEKLEPAS